MLGAALIASASLPGGNSLDTSKTSRSLIRHNSHGSRELAFQAHQKSLRQKPSSNAVVHNNANPCLPNLSPCLNGLGSSGDGSGTGSLQSVDDPLTPASSKPGFDGPASVFPTVLGLGEPHTAGIEEGQTALDGPSSTPPLAGGYSAAVEPGRALVGDFATDPANPPLPSEAGRLSQTRPSDQPRVLELTASQIPATTSQPSAGPDSAISVPEPSTLSLWESLAVLGMALKAASFARQRPWLQRRSGANKNGKLVQHRHHEIR